MPVPRSRKSVDYVIIERDGTKTRDLVGEVKSPLGKSLDSMDSGLLKRQYEDMDDDDDDDLAATVTAPVMRPTNIMTMFPPAPSSTFISPSIETAAPSPQASSGGLSSTTQHLLIAAGSIGSTILLVLVALSVYTMRKRDLTLLQAINHGKNKVTRRGPTPPPKSWDEKRLAPMEYGSMRKSPITPPQRAVSIARSTSSSSQRPLMALERSESFKNHAPKQPHAPQQGSFLLESPLPQRNASHRRNISETPSSPPLIIQTPQRSRSTSTHASRPVSSSSTLRYPPPPPIYSSLNPLPPPPTFKQFLTNRPSASHRTNPVGIASRFSWTNSNAPQTPHDASRDTAVPVVQRDSFMTQRSSVPRFRTIDSWVNQQADRIEVLKLKERFRASQSSNGTSVDERDLMLDVSAGVPGVPVIPTALVSADMGEKRPNVGRPMSSKSSGPAPKTPLPAVPVIGNDVPTLVAISAAAAGARGALTDAVAPSTSTTTSSQAPTHTPADPDTPSMSTSYASVSASTTLPPSHPPLPSFHPLTPLLPTTPTPTTTASLSSFPTPPTQSLAQSPTPTPVNVIKHERQDTRDTAPIFRQHPGTEVRFSTRSVVPSEVLEEVGGLGRVLE